MRIVEPRGQVGLALEPLGEAGVGGHGHGKQLERDHTVLFAVKGAVDPPIPPRPNSS